jgi:hypothetical protein
MQASSDNLNQLTDELSSHALHVLLHIALYWPHSWDMKESELCFNDASGRTVIRLYKYGSEGLTVGKDAAVARHVKAELVSRYRGHEIADAVSLSFDDIEAADVPEFVGLLLAPEHASVSEPV